MSGSRPKDRVEVVREIPAAPERVFRALTQASELLQWWGAKTKWWLEKAQVDARPGGRYRLEFSSVDGKSASIEGEFEVVDPPRRIVQTWRASMYPGEVNRVEYRLEPTPTGTRLTVIHREITDSTALADYESGWVEVLLKLVTFLAASAPLLGLGASPQTKE